MAAPVAAVDPVDGSEPTTARFSDDLPNPHSDKQRALREEAQTAVLAGETTPVGDNKVVKVAPGQYVELARVGEDSILTVLGEFGDGVATHGEETGTHDEDDAVPPPVTHTGPAGPAHNEIEEPDRTVDNTTIWAPDFSREYYMDLLFSEAPGDISMRNMYLEMSSGRYTVNGDVSPWVQVPNNAASYGSDYCGSIVCQDTWLFVNDSVDAWAETFASTADMNAYLAQFDVWDRYDSNGNGNFNEPDGYIDHFQSVHAGAGQETGGGAQGDDAIWSHRWYAFFGANGPDGEGVNGFGGVRIGESNYWIGDYTIEPENGGVGVFAHEFAHDLGLPDLYDTSGNTGGAENSTAFWTLMSSGSYGSSGIPEDGIGSKPMHMGNWEKFQLGWLNYDVAFAGARSSHRVGPSMSNTRQAQGLFVVLPLKDVPLDLGDPCEGCGERYFYSGSGDELNNTMTKAVASGGALTAQVRYDIEFDWDYAFLEASTDGGTTWQPIVTSESQTDSDGESGFNTSRTGITGDSDDAWVPLTATLPAGTNAVRFRYQTDGAVADPGFQVDQIAIDGTLIGTAETEDEGWTFDGFSTTTGSEIQKFNHYYVVENRQYLGFDDSLRTGPYNFVAPADDVLFNWVEHFSYQDGILINYWDTSQSDNSVGDHPGEGLILPIDAHPGINHWSDGTMMRCRIQSYDSTFGLQATQTYDLHNGALTGQIGGLPAVPVFDDSKSYWTDEASAGAGHAGDHIGIPRDEPEYCSVIVPNTGTTIRVKSFSSTGFAQIDVNK